MNLLSAGVVAIMSCFLLKLPRVNSWMTTTTTSRPSSCFRNRAASSLSTKTSPVVLQGYNSFRYSDDFIRIPSSSSSSSSTNPGGAGTTRKMNANNDSDYGNSTTATVLPTAATVNGSSSSSQEFPAPALDVSGLPEQTIDFSTGRDPLLMNEDTVNILGIDPSDVDVVRRNGTRTDGDDEEDKNKNPPVLSINDMFHNSQFVDMFRGSATYIANHRSTLMVFHIPGDYIDNEDPKIFRDLMNDISLAWLLGVKIVIVAGCRYQVEKRMGHRSKHLGMVVTDNEGLRIVKEEAGYVRFEVERQLARSLQGSRGQLGEGNVVSGNFYSAQPFGVIDGVDYKYSGFVRRFEKDKIKQCHQNRDIVLLTALGVSPTGEVFAVNSEYLASYAGGALDANKVIFFLEQDVELRHKMHGSRIPHLRTNDGRALLKLNDIHMRKKGFVFVGDDCPYEDEVEQNMLVKIGWSMQAIESGVKRAHIISPENGALLQELYTRDGSGTLISSDLYDGIRQATVIDVTAIYDLISPLVEQGTLVERPKAKLEEMIKQYHVYTRDDLIVACGQMKMFENGFAELGCLVVNPAYRARGRGDAMLGYLERLAVSNGASVVFVLSTQTMEWFIERGFDAVDVDMLPPSRQATYNRNRNSKIYMKKISSVRDLDAAELFWDR